MQPGLTRLIGAFVASIAADGAPPHVRVAAKDGVIDCIGCLIAGSHDPAVSILQKANAPLPAGRSQLWFSPRLTSAPEAALLNGVAAHVLDFDDVSLRGHPSAVLVPAILAVAQDVGASGGKLLDAYVAGYEVWAELVDRETDFHQMKGWHPTSIFGGIAAAAACAVLYGLDAGQSAHAVALGASQGGGLMSNFGAMSKSFHAGRAAQAGVVSARLALHGYTAAPDALEHPRGFLAAVSPSGNVDREAPCKHLGHEWQLPLRRVNIKKYPTCYYTHRALDAMLGLMQERPLVAEQVVGIDVLLSKEHALTLRNHAPRTALEAKFSIEFAMASVLLAGNAGLSELNDNFVASDSVQQLMTKVRVTLADRYDPRTPGAAWADRVTVHFADGSTRNSGDVHRATGHADMPLSRAELRRKFFDCLAYGKYAGDGDALFTRLLSLEKAESV
jgi:2-methylcitrate dehydratase PrpD